MPPHPFEIPTEADPIRATFYSAAGADRLETLLVLGHGAGAGQSSPFMVAYALQLAARGLPVVTFDFAYMARGRKTPDRAATLEATFRAAVRAAATHAGIAHGPVLIGGKSMGGRMATHLAADPEAWPDGAPPLAGVVVLGYPLAPPGGRRSGDRVTHLRRLTVPTLVVQGTRDAFGGPDEVREAIFADGARPPVDIVAVSGGDHSFAVLKSSEREQPAVHAEIQNEIVRWVAERLRGRNA